MSTFISLPKYTVNEAYQLLSTDSRFSSGTLENYTWNVLEKVERLENPFIRYSYCFLRLDENLVEFIYFNPANGEIYFDSFPQETQS